MMPGAPSEFDTSSQTQSQANRLNGVGSFRRG